MTNVVAKTVHCPTCGSPPGRACRPLNPEKRFIVPSHSARRKLFADRRSPVTYANDTQAEPMLQFFQYAHLPEHLRAISEPFCRLALEIVGTVPRNPERTAALRKLLEAKDCAVRARLYQP